MSKFCIFKSKTLCTECGECNTCDINPGKKCTSCGKCLQMEGVDIKAIRIDEISEEIEGEGEVPADAAISPENADDTAINDNYSEFLDDYSDENSLEETRIYLENNDTWELIDDVDGLSDVLDEENKALDLTKELFPGLITISKSNRNN